MAEDRRRGLADRARRAAGRRGPGDLRQGEGAGGRSRSGPGLRRHRRAALQGRAHRGPRGSRPGRRRARPDDQRLHPGRVHRPLPRPAPAEHGPPRQGHLQADEHRRRLLARRRAQRDADAHLRHRLPEQGRAGRPSRGSRDGPPARPPPHRPRPRPVQLPRRGPGLPLLPPQGHAPLERDHRLLARRARQGGLRRGQHADDPAPRALGAQRALGQLQGQHVLHPDRRQSVRGEAHELPRGAADLQEPPALVPRSADARLRARAGPPPRDERRAPRSLPRALLHPGRRPHLLHAGAARGRGPRRRALHAAHLRRLRLHRRQDRAQHPAGEERSARTRCGRGQRASSRACSRRKA